MAESRRPSPNVAAVLVLALLAGALLLWQRPWENTSVEATTPIPADASTRLTAQFRTLSTARSEEAFAAATGEEPSARAFGARTWRSFEALGGTDLELRYISGGEVADRLDGSAKAIVEVSWRPGKEAGLGAREIHRAAVAFRVAPHKNGEFSIIGATPRAGVLPIWLAGSLTLERQHGSIVIEVGGGDDHEQIAQMASAARAAVVRAVPDMTGDVTIVSPRTQMQMARIVGQNVKTIEQIAAVTTRLDGRTTSVRDVVIVLNPAVFEAMDSRAAQIVLSHEATHLLTKAVGTSAESWVVEGFADYVALRDDTAPLSVSAGQILTQVAAGDVPEELPDATAFESTSHGLGAVYESAWMIFRMLARGYGEAAVIGFYESVIDGTPVERAVHDSFGLTLQQLTANWRDYLTKSASTVS